MYDTKAPKPEWVQPLKELPTELGLYWATHKYSNTKLQVINLFKFGNNFYIHTLGSDIMYDTSDFILYKRIYIPNIIQE